MLSTLLAICAATGLRPAFAQTPRCDVERVRAVLANRQFPPLVGCTVAQARELLGPFFSDAEYNPVERAEVPELVIIDQYPDPGTIFPYIEDGVRLGYAVAPKVSYAIADAPDAIEGEPLVFRVTRSGPTVRPASVAYQVAAASDGGGAIAGTDYEPPEGRVDFAAGSSETDITVATLQRPGPNGPRQVQIVLTRAADGGQIDEPVASGTIVDDPAADATVLAIESADAGRGAPLTFVIRRTGPTAGEITVGYLIEELGADGGIISDDLGIVEQAVIAAGRNSVSLPIDPSECAAQVRVTLSEPGPGTSLANGGTATATVLGAIPAHCEYVPPAACRDRPGSRILFGICVPPGAFPWPLLVLVVVVAVATFAGGWHATRGRRLRARELREPVQFTGWLDENREEDAKPGAQPRVTASGGGVRVRIDDGAMRVANEPRTILKEDP